MDVGEAFNSSFEDIKKKKKIVLPFFLNVIIPMIPLLIYLYASGFYFLIEDAVYYIDEYDAKKAEYIFNSENVKEENYTFKALSYFSGRGEYRRGLVDYMKETGLLEDFIGKFNPTTITFGIIVIIISILLGFYMSTISNIAAMLLVTKKGLNNKEILNLANKKWLSIFWVSCLSTFVYLAPMAVALALPILSIFLDIHVAITVLLFLAFFFFLFFWIVYAVVKLLFVMPLVLVENARGIDVIKKSFRMSRRNFKPFLVVFGVIYGISAVANSVGFSPVFNSVYNLVLSGNAIKSFIISLLLLVFLAIGAAINAFQSLFLFHSYRNIRQKGEKNG